MKLTRLTKIVERINRYHLIGIIIIFLIASAVAYSNLGMTKDFIGDDAGVAFHYSDAKLNKESNMWDSYTFPGRSNVINTTELIHVNFINTLNKIGFTSIFVDRLFYFLCYFISGLGMYFLSYSICSKLFPENTNKIWIAALTGAVFYMLNNFTMILFSFPPTSYIYSYMLLPWIFLLYIKDFHVSDGLLKRLVFSIVFLLILSGNPSNTISIVALILLYEIFFRKENRIIYKRKNFITTLLMILLLSSYIWLPTLGNSGNPYGVITSSNIRTSIDFNSLSASIGNLIRFRGHPAQDNFTFNKFLLSNKAIVANYLLFIIILLPLLRKKISKQETFLLTVFVLFLFLAKSEHPPFSQVNKWIYDNVPLFGMYRASYFKFIYYCIFSFSILLSMSLLRINEKISKLHFSLFSKRLIWVFPLLIVLYCAKPFFLGEVVTKIHKTIIPTEYHDINTYFSGIKTDSSVLSLPQLSSGLTLDWGNGNYYAGGANPDYFLLGRPTWSNGWFLPGNMTSNQFSFFKNMLSRTNVKYIFLHKDIPEEYSFEVNIKGSTKGQANFNQLNDQIMSDKDFKLIRENKYFKVFEISQEKYVSHLYSSNDVSISDQSFNSVIKNLSLEKQLISPVVYFKDQNIGKDELLKNLSSLNNKSKDATKLSPTSPTLEYKKINPTKYRIRVHGAREQFPLIFSESFDNGWKAYPVNSKQIADSGKDKTNLIDRANSSYRILDNNNEDQVSKEELIDFINRGLVTTIGDNKQKEINHKKWGHNKEKSDYTEKYSIDFISKNFKNTIQNDNLKKGTITETWFKTPLDNNKNHLTVNGYANSWIVNPSSACANSDKCTKNADGSYDMELVLEFWPQRLFYLGLFLVGMTLLLCVVCLVYSWRRKKSIIKSS